MAALQHSNLLVNLVLFGRLLRGLGLDVDTGRMLDVVQALRWVDVVERDDFYYALRCLLVHQREHLAVFDRAFELFWRPPQNGRRVGRVVLQGQVRRKKPRVVPPPLRLPDWNAAPPKPTTSGNTGEPPILQATFTYSDREVLRRKNFAELSDDELRAIRRMLASFTWQAGLRRTRRFRPGAGRTFDLRRTLRQNLQYGGEVYRWSRKEPRYVPRPLVVLADISGSMERYTRLLLHFAYGLSRGFEKGGEIFVFSTRLTRITRPMKEKNVDQALRQVTGSVQDWSGGTRIGEALKNFNFHWGRRVLGHGAVVLLISDGWDQGNTDLLRREMARLQRSCYRLIWLNPLLGSEQYRPLARGMQTALPYIDDFLPVHNLASLEDLSLHLRSLEKKAPLRRQFFRDLFAREMDPP
ncbi:MAG: VWA domain-containing protein [Anaerolineaceae bacterium]|nr:VWA domain-containing protein [Anaerolineaceae bacterium]